MTEKVLVTQGIRPLAQHAARQLQQEGYAVIFGAADGMPDVLLRSGNYVDLPRIESQAYVHGMLKTCLDRQVNMLIPLGRQELGRLTEAKTLFGEYGIAILSPGQEVLETLVIMDDPPGQLPVVILHEGRALNDPTAGRMDERLSGVYVRSDSGEDVALCCVGD